MISNWNKANRLTSFRYVRVAWPSFDELGIIDGIVGCTLDESIFTSLKVTGELQYINMPDLGDDMVRVYSDSQIDSETETVCHGTLFVSRPKEEINGEIREGSAQLYSPLLAMRQSKCESTYTVLAGENIVSKAASLTASCQLKAAVTPSSATTSTSHTWDAGTEYLEVVNDLLEMAGYGSISIDAYGNAIIAPYSDPATKRQAAVLSDTEDSVGARTLSREFDTYDVPNVVVVHYSNADNTPLVAVAENKDPENRYSTVSRKKRIVRVETVDEIANQAALDKKARELLESSMTVVDSIDIPHSWLPIALTDAVGIDYRRANTTLKMSVVSRGLEMTPDIACTTRVRRFVNLMEG